MGYGVGYIAGLIALILFLIIFVWPGGETENLYGLNTNEYEHIRIVGPLCAIWYAVFIVPLFLFTPDLKKSDVTVISSIGIGLTNLSNTFKELKISKHFHIFDYKDVLSRCFECVVRSGWGIRKSCGWDVAHSSLNTWNYFEYLVRTKFNLWRYLNDLIGSKCNKLISLGIASFRTFRIINR